MDAAGTSAASADISGEQGAEQTDLPTFRFTFGTYNQTEPWTDVRDLTWPEIASLLTQHRVGAKEGTCVVPAIFRGANRQNADADQIDVAFLDSDSGATLEEIATAVRRQGWAAVVSSTHSHMISRTTVKRTVWERFGYGDQGREAAFLIQEKGLRESVAVNARIVGETADSVTFEHRPCPKFRIALPLLRSWMVADYASQDVANAAWKERLEALAGALALDHDQACTDTSRAFFLPRTPPGGAAPEILAIEGEPCDLFGLPKQPEPLSARQFRRSPTGGRVGSEILLFSDPAVGEVIDLVLWARSYAHGYKIATALRARRPGVLTGHVAEGTKVHLQCVNADAHTLTSPDAATFVMDAGTSANGGFVYHCRHSHCDSQDRLFFLLRMLEEGWLTIADLTDPAF